MDDVGKRRLLELADRLDRVPPERFDMEVWADNKFRADGCGTAACAAGWATTMPSFRDAGLRLERENPVNGWTQPYSYPVFGDFDGFMALGEFFGIGVDAAEGLFRGRTEDTPKSVASNIRDFVENLTPQ